MIPDSLVFDQPTLARLLDHDALVQRYRQFFALLDWSVVNEHDANRRAPGPAPHPLSAYLKAFLIRISEGKCFMTHLRTFLVEHPLLVLELGFHLVLDPTQPYGFDVARTVPSARWLREQLRRLDPALLQSLLEGTVTALQAEIWAKPSPLMSSISTPGSKKTTRASTSPTAMTKLTSPRVIPIASWASSARPTRSSPTARPKRSRNTYGAMAPAWRRPPSHPMAMWCWRSSPSPSTRMT